MSEKLATSPRRKKAAHFLLTPALAGSPENVAVVDALAEVGYDVDLYAPGGRAGDCGANHLHDVEYGGRWIIEHALKRRWRHYSLFSGTSEDPMGVVGVLAQVHRRPSFVLADEIRADFYRGPRAEWWKRLCRRGMRRAELSIVGDPARIGLQRQYLGVASDYTVAVYPGCFRQMAVEGDRAHWRKAHAVAEGSPVLISSGVFGELSGAEWAMAAVAALPELHVLVQTVNLGALTRLLLANTRWEGRVHVDDRSGPRRLPWDEAWTSTGVGDIGMAVYLHRGSQFQHMGTSSKRLCAYLANGMPVVTSRQPSFAFVEKFDCGVMAGDAEEFVAAVRWITTRLPQMKKNALRCADEYIDAPTRYRELVAAFEVFR